MSLSGRCCSPSVLYLHNSRAETEPDLINEFITGVRGSRASNRGGRKVPCGISSCFITLQTGKEEEKEMNIKRITGEEEQIKEQKGREKATERIETRERERDRVTGV